MNKQLNKRHIPGTALRRAQGAWDEVRAGNLTVLPGLEAGGYVLGGRDHGLLQRLDEGLQQRRSDTK